VAEEYDGVSGAPRVILLSEYVFKPNPCCVDGVIVTQADEILVHKFIGV